MAQSCGIHIDQRRFTLVALDGSARKHKVAAAVQGEIDPGDDPVQAVAEALREASRKHKLRNDSVGLVVDSGLAAFRNLTLPFDDRAKIEDVLKFEIENDLPQWDIDDVVVDFLTLNSKPGVESNLLVTALPKSRLALQLEACEKGGLEPHEAELDGTALFNAAYEAGVLLDDAAQILVHVGDATTTVCVVDGERLASIRAIRAGGLPPLASVALPSEEDEDEADETAEPVEDDQDAIAQRLMQSAQRIKRELGRTLSGVQTEFEIEGIYVCGHGLPGLSGEVFEVPVHALEVLPEGSQVDVDPADLVIAYGAAVRALGGGKLAPTLRREELRYSGKFERLELPLAVFSLLLACLLAVQLIVVNKHIGWRDVGTPEVNGDMQLFLVWNNAAAFPDPDADPPRRGRLENPSQEIMDFAKKAEAGELPHIPKFNQLTGIRQRLATDVEKVKRELGQSTNLDLPPSALEAAVLTLEVIDNLPGEGRVGIRGFESSYAKSGTREYVLIKVDMDFFGENDVDATRRYNSLLTALEAEEWCSEVDKPSTTPHEDGKGISADNIQIEVEFSSMEERE